MVVKLFVIIEKSRRDDAFCNAGIHSSERELSWKVNPVGMEHVNVPSLLLSVFLFVTLYNRLKPVVTK